MPNPDQVESSRRPEFESHVSRCFLRCFSNPNHVLLLPKPNRHCLRTSTCYTPINTLKSIKLQTDGKGCCQVRVIQHERVTKCRYLKLREGLPNYRCESTLGLSKFTQDSVKGNKPLHCTLSCAYMAAGWAFPKCVASSYSKSCVPEANELNIFNMNSSAAHISRGY